MCKRFSKALVIYSPVFIKCFGLFCNKYSNNFKVTCLITTFSINIRLSLSSLSISLLMSHSTGFQWTSAATFIVRAFAKAILPTTASCTRSTTPLKTRLIWWSYFVPSLAQRTVLLWTSKLKPLSLVLQNFVLAKFASGVHRSCNLKTFWKYS